MYKDINWGNAKECIQCKKENNGLSKPYPCWLVGNQFQKQDKKIVFVGKNARGEGTTDAFEDGRGLWDEKRKAGHIGHIPLQL